MEHSLQHPPHSSIGVSRPSPCRDRRKIYPARGYSDQEADYREPDLEVPENPDLGYKLRGIPEGPSENQGTDFRNRKFNISKDVGRIRILVVGDSIAWGAGVYRGEDLSAQPC